MAKRECKTGLRRNGKATMAALDKAITRGTPAGLLAVDDTVQDGDGGVVAKLIWGDKAVAEANARLFAAAPEMLALLKHLISWTPPTPADYDPLGADSFSLEAHYLIGAQNAARKLIAKAEGRSL